MIWLFTTVVLAAAPVSLTLPGWTTHTQTDAGHTHTSWSKSTTPCAIELDWWRGFAPEPSGPMEEASRRAVQLGGAAADLITTKVLDGVDEKADVVFFQGDGFEGRFVFRGCIPVMVEKLSERVSLQRVEGGDVKLPWSRMDMRNHAGVGHQLVYARTLPAEGEAAPVVHTVTRTVVKINDAFMITRERVTDASGAELDSVDNAASWEGALPWEKTDERGIVTGTENLSVPAGSFDCVVVRSSNRTNRTQTSWWLVRDQPGHYAQIEVKTPRPEGGAAITSEQLTAITEK